MTQRRYAPLYVTFGLSILTIVSLFTVNARFFPNLYLMTAIWVYIALDIALIATLIWGLFSKEKMVRVFSLVGNLGLIVPLSIWIFLLLLANGISEA
ncbi:hypothetical protein ACNOIU_03520 [Exiguobacterium mexicanum]|uniref:Uncharacterized protein n=1 Tax=Exiguobacterium mexicanum TaxID=340146 RepID=A0ABT7MMN2_9BACL|nr:MULTISPECIES: hypothetical protein [Exiguobacterium]MDL5376457.1 hypothetical protein [Exiguobacterium mexicanum]